MAGKITTNSVVLGDSITDTQNFVLKTNADGTATLARGALGGLGTVLTVDASSNVGIGTASPQSLLDLTGNDPTLRFTDNAGSPAATWSLRSNDANFSVRSVTAGIDRLVIDSIGNVTLQKNISVGGAAPTTSGTGITFPATQSASSDANTLDDYEEGTWTPVPSGQTGSLTSYTSSGTYVKIGKIVNISGRVTLTNVGTAGGQINIAGLPFNTQNVSAASQNGVVRESAATGNVYFIMVLNNSTTTATQNSTNGGIIWTNNYVYDFSATYIAA